MLVEQYERIGHRSNAESNISGGRAVWFGPWKELTPAAGTAKLRDTGRYIGRYRPVIESPAPPPQRRASPDFWFTRSLHKW